VDTRYLRRPRQQMAVIAAAGPATNFVIAIALAAFILHGPVTPFSQTDTVLQYAYSINIVLGIFNLLPIPPLDGSRIVAAAMNEATYSRWSQLDQYGFFVIFGMIIVFNQQWSTFLGSAMDTTTNVIVRLVGG
jgi:Zn-dependent protease